MFISILPNFYCDTIDSDFQPTKLILCQITKFGGGGGGGWGSGWCLFQFSLILILILHTMKFNRQKLILCKITKFGRFQGQVDGGFNLA